MGKSSKPAIINDERLNGRGFRVLNSALIWDDFDNNPVADYNHIQTSHYPDGGSVIFPVGKWVDRKIENGKLVMSPYFNEKYELGAQVEQMWNEDFLNTTSLYIRILEYSEDPAYLVQGQTRPTVTKAMVKAIAIASIPENAGCHKLSFGDMEVTLDANLQEEKLNAILPLIDKSKADHKMNELQTLSAALGVDFKDTADMVAKVTSWKNQAELAVAERDNALAELSQLKAEQQTGKVKSLIDKAINDGKLTEAQRSIWEKMATQNFDSASEALSTMAAYVAPTKQVVPDVSGSGSIEELAKRYDELDKEGKLATLSEEERDRLMEAKAEMLRRRGVAK